MLKVGKPFNVGVLVISVDVTISVYHCTIKHALIKLMFTFQAENWDWHMHRYSFYPPSTSDVISIMTHCYDDSGLRLFAAGGPLPLELIGNYASIWE